MIISLDEAKKIITPDIAAGLAYCSQKAFSDWFSQVSEMSRGICTASVRATFVNDHMAHYAEVVFPAGNSLGVKVIKVHGRRQLLIKDKIIVKMKKFNKNMRSASIQTAAVICYNGQLTPPLNSQYSLFPVEDDITHLINGYQEDSLRIGMKPFIACPLGRRNYWVWPLDFTMTPTAAQPQLPDAGGSPGLSPKPVTPKQPDKDGNPESKEPHNGQSTSVQS